MAALVGVGVAGKELGRWAEAEMDAGPEVGAAEAMEAAVREENWAVEEGIAAGSQEGQVENSAMVVALMARETAESEAPCLNERFQLHRVCEHQSAEDVCPLLPHQAVVLRTRGSARQQELQWRQRCWPSSPK